MNNEENNELIDQNTVQETPLTDNIVNEQPSTISEPVMEELNTRLRFNSITSIGFK